MRSWTPETATWLHWTARPLVHRRVTTSLAQDPPTAPRHNPLEGGTNTIH